jgi:hypothetical protein
VAGGSAIGSSRPRMNMTIRAPPEGEAHLPPAPCSSCASWSDTRFNVIVKSRPARDSLIRGKNSLMARINSLQGRIKFPVPMRRELDRELLYLALHSEPIAALGGPDEQKFRVWNRFPAGLRFRSEELLGGAARIRDPLAIVIARVRSLRWGKHDLFRTGGLRQISEWVAEGAQKSWRRIDGHNQLPKLIQGVKFADGIEVIGNSAVPQAQAAA